MSVSIGHFDRGYFKGDDYCPICNAFCEHYLADCPHGDKPKTEWAVTLEGERLSLVANGRHEHEARNDAQHKCRDESWYHDKWHLIGVEPLEAA